MNRTLIVAAALCGASLSGAQTVFYDNINGYSAWTGTSSYTLRGTGLSNPQWLAQQFTSSATGNITDIKLSVQHQNGSAMQSGTMSVFNDSGNTMSGSPIASVAFGASPTWDSTSLLTFGGLNIPVISGTSYWVQVNPSLTSDMGWRIVPGSANGNIAWAGNAASPPTYFNGPQAGMTVEGTAVPEPMSLGALGIGALGLLKRRRASSAGNRLR
ncbi:MAG: PEP-CTERM sorting domain-containing protein [Fimbriimonadaceae bacterium]|nr:PEP-CTERM sorting domain-containing protein [Fimbriimonadaceae bacterium]